MKLLFEAILLILNPSSGNLGKFDNLDQFDAPVEFQSKINAAKMKWAFPIDVHALATGTYILVVGTED
jgi:hypothetical protein